MKNILILASILAIFIAGCNPTNLPEEQDEVAANGVYCGQNGSLSDTMPIQSHRSYCLKTDSEDKTYSVDSANEYQFSIIDDQGNTLKDFEVTHTKLMHVIAVRKDLQYFQHVHPEYDQVSGVFTLSELNFPDEGPYRIFADFVPDGNSAMDLPVTIFEDVTVGDMANYTPMALGSEEINKTFDGYDVTLSSNEPLISGTETALRFDLQKDGQSVTDLQEYLGALGHTVILREGSLDFIHAHPIDDVNAVQDGIVDFMVTFPEAGSYKAFSQFQRDGVVFTTDFVVTVEEPTDAMEMDTEETDMMPGMDHSM